MVALYHGTDADFTEFSLDFAVREGMNVNGFLGVWMSTCREHAECFGKRCLTVQAEHRQSYVIPISKLTAWHRACMSETESIEDDQLARELSKQFYTRLREDLLGQGFDAIEVVELSGDVDIVIGLRPELLRIVH